jgi:membrane associated rhomboid family serine protease
MFLHGDVVHLLGNMLMLWAFVGTLERGLGSVLFVLLYILWGLVAGVAHAVMNWGQGIPMIGASGAISGVIGAYVVTFGALTNIRTLVWFFGPRQINVPAGAFVFIWVMSQLSGMQEASAAGGGGIAWYAHAGGFVAGATTMLIFSREVKSRLVLNREGKIQFVDREDITEEPEGAEGLEHARGRVLPAFGVDDIVVRFPR